MIVVSSSSLPLSLGWVSTSCRLSLRPSLRWVDTRCRLGLRPSLRWVDTRCRLVIVVSSSSLPLSLGWVTGSINMARICCLVCYHGLVCVKCYLILGWVVATTFLPRIHCLVQHRGLIVTSCSLMIVITSDRLPWALGWVAGTISVAHRIFI